jgi:hypothetical protein
MGIERLVRAGASPTRSDPEGSSRNEPHLGRYQPLTLSYFARRNAPSRGRVIRRMARKGQFPHFETPPHPNRLGALCALALLAKLPLSNSAIPMIAF